MFFWEMGKASEKYLLCHPCLLGLLISWHKQFYREQDDQLLVFSSFTDVVPGQISPFAGRIIFPTR